MHYVENPPNPWLKHSVEWLGEPPEAKLEVFEETQTRKIITHNDSPDVGFDYTINCYRGCIHGCTYCFSRPTHEYLGYGAGTDFDRKIVVKVNAPTLLRNELMQPSWKGDEIVFSFTSDPYIPLEANYKLTRQCLEICLEFRQPIGIITKSALIRRDIDVLQELSKHTHLAVFFTIPFTDREVARAVEPYAPLPEARFHAMTDLAAAGLSLIFGVMKVLNVAHGELIMLGGYGTYWLFALLRMDPFASLLVVIPATLVLGAVLYAVLFGFVVRAHEETRIKNSLLVGFGLALALHALALRLWTADDRSVTTAYGGAVLHVGPLAIPVIRLVSLAIAFALIAGLHLLLARWRWGKAIRATAEDWQAALLTGIDVRRAYLLAFAIGTALAGAAGTLVSVGYSISPAIGLEWTLKALIVVVLAGLGSMLGTFAAGLVVGVAEALSAAAFGGPYREVVGLVIFLVVLVARPQGLFGRPSR